MSRAYYNEIDPFAAQWLRNLIAAGHIAPGDVDERSIEDVPPNELKGYTQCHFFAGIGVWSYALRRAGWPDDRPVWTGSCPCQPFSAAGEKKGFADERHLWPAWLHLISQCRPESVLGEQVASGDGLTWLGTVQADMETENYAFSAVDLCAAGVGAPHIRQRLWFVAEWLANTSRDGLQGGLHWGPDQKWQVEHGSAGCLRPTGWLVGAESSGQTNGIWRDADWLLCKDGKWRPVESGTFPLVNGTPSRMGRLRAYGNAINAELATLFIASYMDIKRGEA
ncbi:DNA cytosine methyltransferase [Serratia fonticola]|uniref:DNA cytosine methyltransferase n=1 Tax=Serratia fonticola TaxID=47917 RepID=UPI001AE3B69A|nr:DNA cytosine methyltransferase [Serratia fonticola]MBP1037859.1 DNA cytosine methyltransferase [Serratia fonticola]